MNLIPITKIKINKEKWLNTKIKYEKKMIINDVLNNMSKIILKWIYNLKDYDLNTDKDSFIHDFKTMIYDKYLSEIDKKYDNLEYTEDYQYFELKYLEEIYSLYILCKKQSDIYNLSFFENKNFMYLFDFIYINLTTFEEEYSDSENEEDYLNYTIDVEKIK